MKISFTSTHCVRVTIKRVIILKTAGSQIKPRTLDDILDMSNEFLLCTKKKYLFWSQSPRYSPDLYRIPWKICIANMNKKYRIPWKICMDTLENPYRILWKICMDTLENLHGYLRKFVSNTLDNLYRIPYKSCRPFTVLINFIYIYVRIKTTYFRASNCQSWGSNGAWLGPWSYKRYRLTWCIHSSAGMGTFIPLLNQLPSSAWWSCCQV